MTINSYAVAANGVVENIVLWDGESEWSPPEGATAVLIPSATEVNIGYAFDGTNFANPEPVDQQEDLPASSSSNSGAS
jgi:hypothetical protein